MAQSKYILNLKKIPFKNILYIFDIFILEILSLEFGDFENDLNTF